MRYPHGRCGHLANPSHPPSAYAFQAETETSRQGAPGSSRTPSSPRREASLFDFGRYPNGLAPFFFVASGAASTAPDSAAGCQPGVTKRFAATS